MSTAAQQASPGVYVSDDVGLEVTDGTYSRVQLGLLPTGGVGTYGLRVVSSDGTTVIIDGTSDVFKVAATGTQSGSIAAHAKLSTVETSLTGLGSLNEAPAHVCYFTGSLAIGNGRVGPGYTYVFAAQDGATRFVATSSGGSPNWEIGGTVVQCAWAYTRLTTIGSPSVPIVGFAGDNATSSAATYYQRYYVFQEAAF